MRSAECGVRNGRRSGGLGNSAFRIPRSAFEAPSLRLGALGLQFPHRFTAQAVQLADGQQNIAGQGVLQLAQFERCAAQATKLLAQALGRERLLFSPVERHRRVEADHMPELVARDEGERLADQAMHFHQNWALESRCVALVTLPQPTVQLGIARFPDLVPNVKAPEVDVPPPEAEFSSLARLTLSLSPFG